MIEGISPTTQNLITLFKTEKIIKLKKCDTNHKRLNKIFDELRNINQGDLLDVFSNNEEMILIAKDYKISTFLI